MSTTPHLRVPRLPRLPRVRISEPIARWFARQPLLVRAAVAVAGIAVAVVLPLVLDQWQEVLFRPVVIYVLLALGLNIVVGMAGLLDLGYVAFFAVGAYTVAKFTTATGVTAWESLPFAIAIAALAGVVLGAPTLRLRGDYLAIVTLGFGEIVRIVAQNSAVLGESRGITAIKHPGNLPGATFSIDPLPYYYLGLAGVVLTLLLTVQLTRSRVGRAWAAIREDEDAAEAMGVPTFTMKLWAFAVGASVGGMAGWLFGAKTSYISPDQFPFFLSVLILAAVVLGGMGSLPGAIAGAFAIGFLPEYLKDAAAGETLTRWLNTLTGGHATNITEYAVLLFGAALVAMMVFRPQGLLPSRQRAAELAEATPGRGLAATAAPTDTDAPPDASAVMAATVDESARAAGEAAAAEHLGEQVDLTSDVTGPVLELVDVTMQFGGVTALQGVSLTVDAGQIFGIIGPNGAGKTTLFNCVTGVFRPTAGSIRLAGREVVGRRPHQITVAGVARTFQNIRLFPNMSALENVIVGTDARHRTSVPGALFDLPRHRREERFSHAEALRLLEYVGIAPRAGDAARNLPYGDQRRLEIARALATKPTVLLLDEPAAGMNPSEKQSLIGLIRKIRDSGVTVVLIEHDMSVVMTVCDRVAVLDFGEKIADGTRAEVQDDPRVIEAYLGVTSDAS